MQKVYCVYEENHGMIGLAVDYQSAITNLITDGWLTGRTEWIDENDNLFTIKEKLGSKWYEEIKTWSIEYFNIFFDGMFYITAMEIWGS